MIKTGGNFIKNLFTIDCFMATNMYHHKVFIGANRHYNYLVAINEIALGGDDLPSLKKIIDQGDNVFIDSGVFNLTMEHARKHNVHMDEALSIPPAQLDGFDKLFGKYVEIIGQLKDTCWGYIEIDAGGREEKIKTRARLEGLGLRPIPVYHPLNDGWDYFDYLAERYDRICFGNIVQANKELRVKLLLALYYRRSKYPGLWIHGLGIAPNTIINAIPSLNSIDSSGWIRGTQWGATNEYTLGRSIGSILKGYGYVHRNEWENGQISYDAQYHKNTLLCGHIVNTTNRNINNHLNRLRELGIEPYTRKLAQQ